MVDIRKVICNLVRLSGVDELAAGEHNELIEKGDDIAARLVNCEDNGPIVIASEGNQTIDDAEGIEGI